MAKIAYNACYGGFGLSHDAIMRYAELKGITIYPFVDRRLADEAQISYKAPDRYRRASKAEAQQSLMVHYCATAEFSNESYWSPHEAFRDRADPVLIQVIEELGDKANSRFSKIKFKEVPSGTLYRIDEYDGNESVSTQSTYEWSVAP